jgi:phenylacetic acid degradation operon negative regulatory protein
VARSAKEIVLHLLAAAGSTPLSVQALIRGAGVLGVAENNLRVTLARLKQAGRVVAVERAAYALAPTGLGPWQRQVSSWRRRGRELRRWRGQWLAVHTGALRRSDRGALRRRKHALRWLGLRELAPGLAIRPDNLAGGLEKFAARLGELGLDAEAPVFRVAELGPEDEARARGLWDTAALDRRYLEGRRELEQAEDRIRALDSEIAALDDARLEAAAREAYELGDAAISTILTDPLLPEPLVDDDARRRFFTTMVGFDTLGRELWRELFARCEAELEPRRAAPESPAAAAEVGA